jgi:hypothetical protein
VARAVGCERSKEEQATLLDQLRSQLQAQIGHMPVVADGRPVQLRAAITQVVTVSPSLDVLSTALAAGSWDRGGAAVEIEALDADTQRQLAALTLGYFAPPASWTSRHERDIPMRVAANMHRKSRSLHTSYSSCACQTLLPLNN